MQAATAVCHCQVQGEFGPHSDHHWHCLYCCYHLPCYWTGAWSRLQALLRMYRLLLLITVSSQAC